MLCFILIIFSKMINDKTVYIWTDGSANNKTHDKGGYGIVAKYKDHTEQWSKGSYVETTSARMEIKAMIHALIVIRSEYNIVLHCDNQYVVNALAKGWVFNWENNNWKNRENTDLWKQFLEVYRTWDNPEQQISFHWVKGHNGDPMNELADHLAKKGASNDKTMFDLPQGTFAQKS